MVQNMPPLLCGKVIQKINKKPTPQNKQKQTYKYDATHGTVTCVCKTLNVELNIDKKV